MIKTKKLSIIVLCALFINTLIFSQTTLDLANSYSISDDVNEPSGLAFDKLNNQLFTVSDTGDIYRLSITGDLLETYDLSGDLEGVTTYNTPNTLLIAIEDTYQIIEYNYVTGNSTSHTMNYDNQGDPGSGIEGVTYNNNTGEIYFLNEKDPGALIVANSNFNVTDEYELTYADDYSASYYVSETNELWLGSDDESTIYRCNIDGSVIESFEMSLNDDELDKIEGIAIDYDNQLLYVVTDGGGELLVYEINSETIDENLIVSTNELNFDADGGSQTVTVTSNIDWTVSENSAWISLNRTNGSNNDIFTIITNENTSTNDRSAIITVTGSEISRTVSVFQEGIEEEIISTDNLALNGNATQSSTAFNGAASRAIDGNTNGNYSSGSVTHTSATTGSWWQVELDSDTNIGDIIIYNRTNNCCTNRLSNFTILVLNSNRDEVFRQTITETPSPSITINADGAFGNTIQVVSSLTNTALSLAEVEVYAGEETNNPPTETCSAGTNVALNGTIVDFSAEQNSTNTVQNIIDNNENNRWSAINFPQFVTIDLGNQYLVNEMKLATFRDRDYQFILEGSVDTPNSGFSTLVDATDNTDEGTINRTFSAKTIRYIKLTITGANSYTGPWSSISEFEIICAGTSITSNKNLLNQDEIIDKLKATVFPNPFRDSVTVVNNNILQNVGSIQLTDLTGKVITKKAVTANDFTLTNLNTITNGVYLLVVYNTENQLISTTKVIKE